MYFPFSLALCLGVLTMAMISSRGRIASSVPATNPDQLRTCSSDRKRWMLLQVKGKSLAQFLIGMWT